MYPVGPTCGARRQPSSSSPDFDARRRRICRERLSAVAASATPRRTRRRRKWPSIRSATSSPDPRQIPPYPLCKKGHRLRLLGLERLLRREVEFGEQRAIFIHARVCGGEEFVAVKDGV